MQPQMNTDEHRSGWPQPKTWRFFASSRLCGKGRVPIHHEDTKTRRITVRIGGSKMKSRRDFLFDSYLGLGALALKDLLGADFARAASGGDANLLAAKPHHHPAKAKSCIILFMEGGVSQMDTIEYKPSRPRYAGKHMHNAESTHT